MGDGWWWLGVVVVMVVAAIAYDGGCGGWSCVGGGDGW